jgi:hypothetical protein
MANILDTKCFIHILAVPHHFEYLYVAPLAAVEGSVIHTSVFSENKTVSSVVNQMVRFMNFLLVQIWAGNYLITSPNVK